jgi:hypothetical protein
MKPIQELTRDTQILCDSDEQRTAVFALCEQAGYKFYLPEMIKPFDKTTAVLVQVSEKDFWDIVPMAVCYTTDTIPATEFLTDKKAEI